MLYIWTGAKFDLLKRVVKPMLVPHGVPHTFIEISDEVPALQEGDVLLSMGSKALPILENAGVIRKGRSVTSLRQQAHPMGDGTLLVTFDPNITDRDYSMKVSMEIDIMLAARVAMTGSIAPQIGAYEWVKDFNDVITYVESEYQRTGNPVAVTTDLETVGLDPYARDKFIVSIFFTVTPGRASGIRFRSTADQPKKNSKLLSQIKWLLTSDKVNLRGANLKYDLLWMRVKWGLVCTSFKFDTTLVGSLLDENRSNSLNTHAKLMTTMGGYDDPMNTKYDKSRMDLIPDDDLLPYAGGDTDATYRVSEVMKSELLKDKGLTKFYVHLLHPATRCFEDMEYEGVLIDQGYYATLREELVLEQERLTEAAINMLPGRIRAKYADNLSLTRAAIIKEYMFSPMGLNLKPTMFTEKDKAPSTAFNHLATFAGHPDAGPFIDLLKQYNSASKTLGTYVDGFLAHLREDGRFHATAVQYHGDYGGGSDGGTVTGRLAFRDPAMQCCVGETEVITSEGLKRIDWLVENTGAGLKVLTHTGRWRGIIGVYDNGVRPTFTVKLKSGHSIQCTGNHPILTSEGWVRTDELKVGAKCYAYKGDWTRAPYPGVHELNVSQLDSDEEQMQQPDQQGLGQVRDKPWPSEVPSGRDRYAYGEGTDENENPELGVFEESEVVSITPSGDRHTFDLTIDRSHSFVANGMAVHNTVPKHTTWAKKLRKGYIAPPGFVVVNWDFSQGELRIMACIADEKNMIEGYRKGLDQHLVTGATLNGYTLEEAMALKQTDPELFKALRQGGKAGNFGLIYGMMPPGFVNYAWDTYGVHLTLEKATHQRDTFFELYPGLPVYHTRYKNIASRLGYVQSPLGRVRHLPLINSRDREARSKAERQAINSVIQATLSDLAQLTLVEFKKSYGTPDGCRFCMTTHDSLTAYVREDEVELWGHRVKDLMENLPLQKLFGWKPQLTFTADWEMGPNMADMVEMK